VDRKAESVTHAGAGAHRREEVAPSEIGVARRPRERNHIPNVGHPGQEHQQPLEPQTEPGVRHRAETSQIHIPL
jgi:hypothetical protein